MIFDTNILIDALNGHPDAEELLKEAEEGSISIVTWIEVMAGARPDNEVSLRTFLGAFRLVQMSPKITERTVVVRRSLRLKLPDALILATALTEGSVLVTRNTRDFKAEGLPIRVPYVL